MIRVVLADDQALFRAGIAMLLRSQPDMDVVDECADGAQAVRSAARHQPDVMLMDVRMPTMDGIEATRRITAATSPATDNGASCPRVLVLTTFDLDDSVTAAIAAGASGFILKSSQPEFVLAAIRAVAAGDQIVSAGALRRLLEHTHTPVQRTPDERHHRLTPREKEIFLHAARGLSNAEISALEVLSEATVKTHISRILTKMGLRDRIQLVIYAYEHGLI
ncbi:two component transcriptional regulator, LuxR family [Austwickia chelonae]|uniref:Putative two-component response regulator n=1 Tax=Austwickia chelonae NBRC 105200 TaxID=1184607 RepID=K6UMX5_9MICO|nr:response regulator transcription factor [Austwickia chelonae]GAB78496.1 putative two-component response regulator [Austwickia chelonae NBRC 105200]SEW40145.1 two component transcriptional regulator, LuxR family [Austwickia chelonae]